MIPRPAQYLLRFDDLCPTVHHEHWMRFVPLIKEFGIRPILAVVPENQDPNLRVSDEDPDFWMQMNDLEAAGATIALHGFRHLCHSLGKSLVPLREHSEFAGVDESTQRQWIQTGKRILKGHGLTPKMFVAPRHGFDRWTLRGLRKEGITILSDGLARVPFVRGGVTWIPQQLWEPVEKQKGLWTICLHVNTARSSTVDQVRFFLQRHAAQFTSVDRVMTELQPQELSFSERVYEEISMRRIQFSRVRKKQNRSRARKLKDD
jgi:predicted deacetylase